MTNITDGDEPTQNPITAWMNTTHTGLEPDECESSFVSPDDLGIPLDYGLTLKTMVLRQQIPVPNNPITAAGMRSIACFGPNHNRIMNPWVEENGTLRTEHSPSNSKIEISLPDSCFAETLTYPSLMMSVTALLLSLGTSARRENVPAVLLMKDILNVLQVASYGKMRKKIADDIRRSIMILNSLRIKYEGLIGPGKDKVNASSDSLVRVTPITDADHCRRGAYDDGWELSLGAWSEAYLTHDKRRGFNWTATMPLVLLDFDWRTQRPIENLAKKIGLVVLAFPGGTAIFKEHQQRLRVENLLALIGELPKPSLREEDWAGRTRKRLNSALHLLEKEGVFTKAQYEHAPSHSHSWWANEWLQSNLVFSVHPQTISTISGE